MTPQQLKELGAGLTILAERVTDETTIEIRGNANTGRELVVEFVRPMSRPVCRQLYDLDWRSWDDANAWAHSLEGEA